MILFVLGIAAWLLIMAMILSFGVVAKRADAAARKQFRDRQRVTR